jgi:hypothetical protein
MPAGVAVVPARSRSEITNFNSLLHSGVTKALALPSKTQRADSRQRARAQRSYMSLTGKVCLFLVKAPGPLSRD